jgi:hypothetical protein
VAEGDGEQTVVAVTGPVSIGVAGEEPEGAIGGLGDVAQAAVGAGVVIHGGRRVGDGYSAEGLAPEVGDEEGVADDGDAAEARLVGDPLLDGVGVAGVIADAFDDGPAVVGAGGDEVELVPGVLPDSVANRVPSAAQAMPCGLRCP